MPRIDGSAESPRGQGLARQLFRLRGLSQSVTATSPEAVVFFQQRCAVERHHREKATESSQWRPYGQIEAAAVLSRLKQW